MITTTSFFDECIVAATGLARDDGPECISLCVLTLSDPTDRFPGEV